MFSVGTNSYTGIGSPDSSSTSSPLDYSQAPAYLQAADNHNIGNDNSSWFDPSTWNPGQSVVHAGYFAASALASGLNSFYNTGAAVANWAGADVEQNDVATQLSALDSDMGAYYQQNRGAIDTVGFIATSFIPGIGSIKVLNAGQHLLAGLAEGNVGINMARSVGLLANGTERYALQAGAEIAQTNATYSLINSSVQRSIASGFGQAALESAAFEVATTATMKQSPMLQDQDTSDIIHNIITGAFVGGAIGGAVSAAVGRGITKRAISAADVTAKPLTDITSFPGMTDSDKVISAFSDLADMHAFSTTDVGQSIPNRSVLMNTKTDKLLNQARSSTRALTLGDDQLGNIIADSNVGLDSDQVAKNMFGVQDITRVGDVSPTDEAIADYIAKSSKQDISKGSVEDPQLAVKYVKLHGEGTGSITNEAPTVTNIADNVEPLRSIGGKEDYQAAVQKVVDNYTFTPQYEAIQNGTLDQTKLEARYIWAKNQTIVANQTISDTDIPLIEQAVLQRVPFTLRNTSSTDALADEFVPADNNMLGRLKQIKDDFANSLQSDQGLTNPEIAKAANIKLSYLEGTVNSQPASDLFAQQTAQNEFNASRVASGIQKPTDPPIDLSMVPSYAKLGYSTKAIQDVDGNIVSGMAAIKANYNVYQTGVDNAFSNIAGDLTQRFNPIEDKKLLGVNRNGAGPGNFSFAGGAYNSIESDVNAIGAATHDLKAKLITGAREELNPVAFKLANSLNAAIEFQAINDKVLSTAEDYIINDTGTGLISKKIAQFQEQLSAGNNPVYPRLQEGAPEEIPFNTKDAADAVTAHINVNGSVIGDMQSIQAAQGIENSKDSEVFHPIRPNEKNYPYKAFVVDDSISGVGHTSMLHAADETTLNQMIQQVQATTNFKTITVGQSEEYHKAIGDWNYDLSLHDNYIDSSLKRNGISSPFFQQTDPQKIANDFMDYHTRLQTTLANEAVNAKYGKEFDYFRNQADSFANEATSQAGNANVIAAQSDSNNPYLSYLRTALDINQLGTVHPTYYGMQVKLDKIVSQAWDSVAGSCAGATTVEDLDNVNQALSAAGVTSGYRDAATELLANHSAPQGALNTFVRRANSIMSGLLIRTDAMNALNTALGHNVLLGAETNHVVSAIQSGRSDLVGELSDLMKVDVPGTGTGNVLKNGSTENPPNSILSSAKLIKNSIKNFFDPDAVNGAGQNLRDFYSSIGQSSSIRDQMQAVLGTLAVNGTEDASSLSNKIDTAFTGMKSILNSGRTQDASLQAPGLFESIINKGEQLTGNSFVHGFNQFIAADVMRQITDLGIKGGVITPAEQLGYINTFTNRVHGNILASQRPLMFQGPIGNAIGLFQSYQFNMMQQAFRYVADGSAKDAAIILGLQGTLHGVNGLPGFNFMNQKIVGEASGNPNHTDLTGTAYNILGKQYGDWFLYGAPSNILGSNLYTRGDLNPRNTTVIPTSIADIPAVGAFAKFFGNLKDAVTKVGDGGALWETFLQGIEHNGISRPLAGLAQTLQGATNGGTAFSTTSKGNIIGANDIFSLATAARLMGGKPLDEAITHDEVMRLQAYQAADTQRKEALSEAIKTTVIGGGMPTPDQVDNFSQQYAALGGKQNGFAREVANLTKIANTSQANVLASNLRSPKSTAMQRVMGGDPVMDGRNIVGNSNFVFNQSSDINSGSSSSVLNSNNSNNSDNPSGE